MSARGSAVPLNGPATVLVGLGTARKLGAAGATVSTVSVTNPEVALVLPAASCATAVSACGPSARFVTGVTLHAPSPPVLTRPITTAPSCRTSVVAASAVPAITGRRLAVGARGAITGRAGAVKSIVIATGSEGCPAMLLPKSVATAVRGWTPSASAAPSDTDQAPPTEVVAVPSRVAPSNSATRVLVSAVPARVGWPELKGPAEVMTGGGGPTKVIVRAAGALAGLSLPAASTAKAVTVWRPRFKGAAGTTLHWPASSVRAVPSTVLPSCTRTVTSASAVPAMAGRATLKVPLTAMFGAGGGVRSTRSRTAAERTLRLPAASTATAVADCSPSTSPLTTVTLHVPSAAATPDPITVLPTARLSALPASAVPRSSGVRVRRSPGATKVGRAGAVTSIRILRVAVGPTLPATSVAAKARSCAPSASALAGRRDQSPKLSAKASPNATPETESRIVASGSPLPRRVGWVVLNRSAASGTGAAGAVRSITRTVTLERTLSLPTASTACAVRRCSPSEKRCCGVKAHAPLAKAVVAPKNVAPSKIFTAAPASPKPLRVGVSRRLGLCTESVGTNGARVSMASSKMLEGALVNSPLRARAVRKCAPSAKAVGGR